MTDPAGLLELSAELALGFLAFSAVIITLRDQRFRDHTARNLTAALLHIPTILLIASVAPLIVGLDHDLDAVEWRFASGILLVVWSVDFGLGLAARRGQPHNAKRLEVAGFVLLVALPALANVVGLYRSAAFGYAIGLGALLLSCALIFVRLAKQVTAER